MENLKQYFESRDLENGFLRINSQPHTKDIEALKSCCSGVVTGEYYFVSKYFGIDIDGENIISEIAKLQDTDVDSPTYGCLRWYREEPCIRDTNGAFFVLRPIVMSMLFCEDKISEAEREIILHVLRIAGNWFIHECNNSGYFYPNKISSDGALLLAIGTITKEKELLREAYEFWNNYMDYTENYGWGWGENTSKCYHTVMNAAFELALCCMDNNSELYKRLYKARSILVDYSAYHGNYAFVPSIRTYNFGGKVTATQGLNIAEISPKKLVNEHGKISYNVLMSLILHDNAPEYIASPDSSTFHTEKIYGNSYAATYKGENIRLGTINKFPVMPGCYQNRDWGLGWQSMPVSVLALKHELSFLRFAAVSDGGLRTHIAYDKHSAYLDNNLFADENIPDILTECNQKNNTAVIVRKVTHLANRASYFADEWYFQHFDGEISEYKEWYVFDYGDCVLAVKPLNANVEIMRDGENIRLAQKFYDGEEKLLVHRYLVAAWAAAVFDSSQDWQNELDKIKTSYTSIPNPYFPRTDNTPFKITCGEASLDFEPYKNDLL